MSNHEAAFPNKKAKARSANNARSAVHPAPAHTPVSAAVQRALHQPQTLTASDVIQIQSASGNQAAGDLLENRLAPRLQNARSAGQPLPEDLRSRYEAQFGADFNAVQVHTAGPAASLTRTLGARAFTHGQDIFFSQGRYNPDTPSGQGLLAHELAHVAQQQSGRTPGAPGQPVFDDSPSREAEADRASRQPATEAPAAGETAPAAVSASHAAIQMDPEDDTKSRARQLWQLKDRPDQSKEDQDLDYKMAQQQLGRENTNLNQLMTAELLKTARTANPGGDPVAQKAQAALDAPGANQVEYQGDLQARASEINNLSGVPTLAPSPDDLKKAYAQQQFERTNAYSANTELQASQVWKEKGRPQGQSMEQMTDDYHQGRMRAMLDIRPATRNTSASGAVLHQSGEFETDKATGTKTYTPAVIPTSQGGKIPQSRKDLLKNQLIASGRASTDLDYANANPGAPKLNLDPSSPTFTTDLPTTKTNLSRKRPSGIDQTKVDTHIGTILDKNSDDAQFPERQLAGGSAPLGHSHTAHGFQIPAKQQIERALVGVRPDQIGTTPNFTATGGNIPVNLGHLADPTLNTITQVSEYPQVPGANQNIGFGTASQYTSSLSEYNAFSQNYAEGWQEQQRQSHHGVINPATGVNFTDPEARRIAVTNQQTVDLTKPVAPPAMGRGFKVNNPYAGAAPPPGMGLNFNRAQALPAQSAKITMRANNLQVDDQQAYKTVLERAQDAQGRFNGFNTVTNFPDSSATGISVRAGNTDVPISPVTVPTNSTTTDQQNLQASQNRIQTGGHETKFEGGGTVYSKPGVGGMERYKKVEIQGNEKVTFNPGPGDTWIEASRVPL